MNQTIVITGAGSEMQGVGRLSDGRAVFVSGALPGETVEIEITREQPRFCEARLLRVISASGDRVSPLCPYFSACGGCDGMHMTYEETLTLKREKVESALRRIGGIADANVLPVIPSENRLRYRNKAEFPVSGAHAGCFRRGTNRVIDIDACMLQNDALNRALAAMRPHLTSYPISFIVPRVNRAGEMMLTLSSESPLSLRALVQELTRALPEMQSLYACRLRSRPAHALDGEMTRVYGKRALTDAITSLTFSLSPKSFFQVNPPQAERLYDTALSLLALTGSERVADVYCGAGTISLLAARKCAHVTGIEIVPEAVADARENAIQNGLSEKTEFIAGDAARVLAELSRTRAFDAALLDPPRKGAEEGALRALIALKPAKIAYISCNPATLARDAKILVSGGYRAGSAQPFDMFPYTHHVETVLAFTLDHR